MNRRNFVIATAAFSALGACTVPQGGQGFQIPQPQAGQGLILLYRPTKALGAVLQMPVTVDGSPIGSLANGGFLTRGVSPGQYLVQTTAPSIDGVSNVNISIAAGETVYMRGETLWGYPAGRAKLVRVSASQAQSEIARM